MLLGFAEAFMLREESAETDIYSFYKSVYSLIRNISIHPCPPYGNVSVSSFNPRRDKGDPTTGEHYLNLNEILSSGDLLCADRIVEGIIVTHGRIAMTNLEINKEGSTVDKHSPTAYLHKPPSVITPDYLRHFGRCWL